MLYPLKFNSVLKEKVWGGKKIAELNNLSTDLNHIGENWMLSTLPGNESIVINGQLKGQKLPIVISQLKEELLGKKIYKKFGEIFPLLIKMIDADDDLSVQVHPDDETAQKLYKENGKNELWYILDSENYAELIVGVKEDTGISEFKHAIDNNALIDKLNTVKVKRGDMFFIPAGRIHAIKKGAFLVEIQQPSDRTYRLYDWNRKGLDGKYRELHIEDACRVSELTAEKKYHINYPNAENDFVNCISTPYFSIDKLNFDKKIDKKYSGDSFHVIINTAGSFKILTEGYETEVSFGETVLIPAELKNVKFFPQEKSELLDVFIT